MCIAYNSLLVALIRYIHIVHDKTSNQWNYERAAKIFKLASIYVPIAMEAIGNLSHGFSQFAQLETIRECIGLPARLNTSNTSEQPLPGLLVNWTLNYLPVSLVTSMSYTYVIVSVIVSSNIVEAYFYLQIFKKMKRYFIKYSN